MQLPIVWVNEKLSCEETAFFSQILHRSPVRQHHSTSMQLKKNCLWVTYFHWNNRHNNIPQWSNTVISWPYWGCLKELVKNWEFRSNFFKRPIFSTIHQYFYGSNHKFQIFVIKSFFWQNIYTPSRFIGNICKYKQSFWTLHNSFFYKLYPQFRYFLRTWSSSCNCNWHFDRWLITPTNISLVILFGTAKMNTMHRSFKVPTILWVWLCYYIRAL